LLNRPQGIAILWGQPLKIPSNFIFQNKRKKMIFFKKNLGLKGKKIMRSHQKFPPILSLKKLINTNKIS